MVAEQAGELNRFERRKKKSHDKIIKAALKLFEKDGIADTTIIAIVEEAGIAHKTFFNHFPSKDHLLRDIVSQFTDYAYVVFAQAVDKYDDPKKQIEYTFLQIAKGLEPLSPHHKELINYYLISGATGCSLREEQEVRFYDSVKQIMSKAKRQGMLCSGFTQETLTDMVIGLYVSTLTRWSLKDAFPLVSQMRKTIKFINASVFVDPVD